MDDAYLPTASEMSALDSLCMRESGISSLELMERVGHEITRQLVLTIYRKPTSSVAGKRTLILVGPGNNGGDGLVVARLLQQRRHIPVTVVLAENARLSPECKVNLSRYLALGGHCYRVQQNTDCLLPIHQSSSGSLAPKTLDELLLHTSFVVDALLGIGQNGAPRGNIRGLLEQLWKFRERDEADKRTYIAVDIPTGISGDTGEVYPLSFQADTTLTVQHRKLGMTQNQAPEQCGSIRLIDGAIRSSRWNCQFRVADSSALCKLPQRTAISHKGTFGQTLILAGSADMPGAGTLATLGAFASGVGKVSQLRFASTSSSFLPEVIHLSASAQHLSTADLTNIISQIDSGRVQSLVLGPGIGTAPETGDCIFSLLEIVEKKGLPIVIDADALNLISTYPRQQIKPLLSRAVITPHAGEAARLLGTTPKEVQRDRPATVRRLYEEYRATVVLKGGGSLAYDGKEGRVNLKGNGFLATAGSGDILSGVIGGFLSQGLSTIEAAGLSMYLHGEAAEHIGARPLRASELALIIPELIGSGLK